MDYKFKQGQRVRILDVESLSDRKKWAGREVTLKEHDAGGYEWEVPAWNVEEPDCPYRFRESEMALAGPVVTETVTVRRLEPGVYGRLRVLGESEVVGRSENRVEVSTNGFHNSAELRELARVAHEIAEYLDAQ